MRLSKRGHLIDLTTDSPPPKRSKNNEELVSRARKIYEKHGYNFSKNTENKFKVDAVIEYWRRKERGHVVCGRVSREKGFVRVYPDPKYIPIAFSKGKGEIGTDASPFTLTAPEHMYEWATVDGTPNSARLPTPQKLETVWQGAKIITGEHAEKYEDYFSRRKDIYNAQEAKRSYVKEILPKNAEGMPDYSSLRSVLNFGDKPLYDYVPSRSFYCTAYSIQFKKTKAYRLLNDLVEEGICIELVGPEGFPIVGDDYSAAYNDTSKQFGHERVAAAILNGKEPWPQWNTAQKKKQSKRKTLRKSRKRTYSFKRKTCKTKSRKRRTRSFERKSSFAKQNHAKGGRTLEDKLIANRINSYLGPKVEEFLWGYTELTVQLDKEKGVYFPKVLHSEKYGGGWDKYLWKKFLQPSYANPVASVEELLEGERSEEKSFPYRLIDGPENRFGSHIRVSCTKRCDYSRIKLEYGDEYGGHGRLRKKSVFWGPGFQFKIPYVSDGSGQPLQGYGLEYFLDCLGTGILQSIRELEKNTDLSNDLGNSLTVNEISLRLTYERVDFLPLKSIGRFTASIQRRKKRKSKNKIKLR